MNDQKIDEQTKERLRREALIARIKEKQHPDTRATRIDGSSANRLSDCIHVLIDNCPRCSNLLDIAWHTVYGPRQDEAICNLKGHVSLAHEISFFPEKDERMMRGRPVGLEPID